MRSSCSRPPSIEGVAVNMPTVIATTSSARTSSRSVPSALPASSITCTAAVSRPRDWDMVTAPEAKTARSASAISRLAAT